MQRRPPRVFSITEGPEGVYVLSDDTGTVRATHARPRWLSNLAFDTGADECRHDYNVRAYELREQGR